MTRLFRLLGAVLATLVFVSPAFAADNYRITEATGAQRVMAATDVDSVLYPRQLIQGMFGGVPTPVTMTTAGALNMNCIAGCSGGGGGVVTNAGTFAVQVTAALPTGANTIGTVNIGGTLPAFASTPTFNIGTGSVGISGTLPAFAATPTFNIGTAGTQGTGSQYNPPAGGSGIVGYLSGILAASLDTTPVQVQPSGATAVGVTPTENPIYEGCRAATALPTGVTNGQKAGVMCTPDGKLVTVPYASDALRVRGSASTATNTATTLIAAPGASIRIYVAAVQCFRTDAGTSPIYVTLNDSSSTTVPVPAGSGASIAYPIPLQIAANTALTFTPSSAVTSTFCNAQGYQGS